MKLWIGNMAPGTTDATLREFVAKYAGNLECTEIQRVEGDGSRPAAILTFAGAELEAVPRLALRLNGMYWQGRRLTASAT